MTSIRILTFAINPTANLSALRRNRGAIREKICKLTLASVVEKTFLSISQKKFVPDYADPCRLNRSLITRERTPCLFQRLIKAAIRISQLKIIATVCGESKRVSFLHASETKGPPPSSMIFHARWAPLLRDLCLIDLTISSHALTKASDNRKLCCANLCALQRRAWITSVN